jgi:uncharacterized protein (TIGR02145 family)
MIKKDLLIFIALLMLTSKIVYTQGILVHKKDGTFDRYYTHKIDSITIRDIEYGFPCPDAPTVTDIDGNQYNTVMIGGQCWMKENLKTLHDPAGNKIMRYCYEHNLNNCELYGGLYLWNTLMNGESSSDSIPSGVQGICPDGWHVPSDAEWLILFDFLAPYGHSNYWDNQFNPKAAGNALKSCRQINSPLGGDCNTSEHPRWSAHNNMHGFDEYGFSALPGGYCRDYGSFYDLGSTGYWWTTTISSGLNKIYRIMRFNYGIVDDGGFSDMSYAVSVRCIKD